MTFSLARPRRMLRRYRQQVAAFHPNARLYLTSAVISGAAFGVFRLLFNFYVLSLGYDESLLGVLITVGSFTALLAALPMGYLSDLIGRKAALLLGGGLNVLAIAVMLIWPTRAVFLAMNVVSGLGQSLAAVTMSPFLVENSGEEERTYLFSLSQGLQTAAGFFGNWIGGYLPTWAADWLGTTPTDSRAYAGALAVVTGLSLLALLPLLGLRPARDQAGRPGERSVFAPLRYAAEQPRLLVRLILPMLLTSMGAGLIMPFMNVFYRTVHGQPDPVIGSLFAWGSLAMGLGILVAPPLADRFGKIQLVVVSQALSIPFLVLMGFAPWFWLSAGAYYIRLTLMNMGGPVYNAFVMEQVEPEARGTVASLVSMSWSFGWAFSPSISGWLQVHYGFAPAFAGTISLYSLAVFLYWRYFWRGESTGRTVQ